MIETKASDTNTVDALDRLIAIFDGKVSPYNEEEEDYIDVDDLFREQIAAEMPEGKEMPEYGECGSTGRHAGDVLITDTPRSLYRLLYLVKPKAVDFSDMYKSEMFHFFSKDFRFLVQVYLFKYELGLYFYCLPELLEGKGRGVWAGMPGANNGYLCKDEAGRKFFEMVAKAANYKWMVYGGNDFEV